MQYHMPPKATSTETLPRSGTYFETVPFNENDFKLKDDAAASKTR